MFKFVVLFAIFSINVFAKIPIYAPEDDVFDYDSITFYNKKYFPNVTDTMMGYKYKLCMEHKDSKFKSEKGCIAHFTEMRSSKNCFLVSDVIFLGKSNDYIFNADGKEVKKGEVIGYSKSGKIQECGITFISNPQELKKIYNDL